MLYSLWKEPFSKSTVLSGKLINDLLLDLPQLDNTNNSLPIEKKGDSNFYNYVDNNWKFGSFNLNNAAINKLSLNSTVNKIKKKLIKFHNLKNDNLYLKHGCIFYPSKCKYLFEIDKQKYIYHKYHLDSAYRIKALISLDDSHNETEQFSYIKNFPEPKLLYFLRRHILAQLIIFSHRLLYIISLRTIKLSGQAPNLPKKYQIPKLYKKYNSLKRGEMITFHNLYPHSSHNGYSKHHTPMLQLVFDIK
tara:strand:+ start:34 stop:777 length:744 start_codon:yes stop_codon:yes gene_type:complete